MTLLKQAMDVIEADFRIHPLTESMEFLLLESGLQKTPPYMTERVLQD